MGTVLSHTSNEGFKGQRHQTLKYAGPIGKVNQVAKSVSQSGVDNVRSCLEGRLGDARAWARARLGTRVATCARCAREEAATGARRALDARARLGARLVTCARRLSMCDGRAHGMCAVRVQLPKRACEACAPFQAHHLRRPCDPTDGT